MDGTDRFSDKIQPTDRINRTDVFSDEFQPTDRLHGTDRPTDRPFFRRSLTCPLTARCPDLVCARVCARVRACLFLLLLLFFCRPQPVDPNNTTVFVGNLRSGDVTAAQLETLFGAVGPLNGVSWVVVVVVWGARHRPLTPQAERSLRFHLFHVVFSFFISFFSVFRCVVLFWFRFPVLLLFLSFFGSFSSKSIFLEK